MKAQIFYFLIFLISWFLIFWGLNKLIVKKLSYELEKRYLHFRLIISGILVSLITANAFSSSYVLLLVDKIINNPTVGSVLNKILPNRSYELIYILLCSLGLNLIYTLLLIITFFITKIIFGRKSKFIEYEYCLGVERVLRFPWYFVNKFYKDKNGKYALTSKGFFIGLWTKGMKAIFALLWIGEFAILYYSILWGTESWNERVLEIAKSVYLLPMVAFFLTEQLQLFLEGPETSDVGTFGSVEIKEQMIGNVNTLTYRYRESLGSTGVLLYSEYGKGGGVEQQGLCSNDLGRQQLLDCANPGVLAVVSNQLREAKIHQTPNYQNAIISLLNGGSILVRDHADGEFLIYLCTYLNHFLSQGQSVLILCPDNVDVQHMKDALKINMEKLNNLDSVWNICCTENLNTLDHISVLISTYEEFIQLDILKEHPQLAQDIFLTVVTNSNLLFSQDNIRLGMLFSKLQTLENMEQYAFVTDEDNSSLSTKIKLFIASDIKITAYSNDNRIPKTDIMVWKEESTFKPQLQLGIGKFMSPHLGTALPLALVAAKYDLPQINIVAEKQRGDVYFFGDAKKRNDQDISAYIGSKKNDILESIVRYSPEEAMIPRDLKMLIVYDVDYNFYNALWRWMKYGGNIGTLIHVVSPFYMLREYFAANFKRKDLLNTNNEFDALLPKEMALKHSRLASLLAMLGDDGLTEDEVMAISQKYRWDYTNVVSLLRDALLTVLPPNEVHSIYEHFHFEEDNYFRDNPSEYVYQTRIKLIDTNVIAKQKRQVALARMSSRSQEEIELPILGKNIKNYYLPDQIIAVNGEFYIVSSVGDGIVYTSSTAPSELPEYYPVSDFYLRNYHIIEECTDYRLVDINVCEAEAYRTIYGYASCSCGNDLFTTENYSFHRINAGTGVGDSMAMSKVPIFEINILRETFGTTESEQNEIAQKAVNLFAVMLNGLFRTLFPDTWQNLYVFPEVGFDDELIKRVMDDANETAFNDAVSAIIPRVEVTYQKTSSTSEDSVERKERDKRYIRLYILEFSCVEYGMVQTIRNNFNNIINQIYEYLTWYIASNKALSESDDNSLTRIVSGKYLYFGANTYPDIFAADELLTVLKRILRTTEQEQIVEPDPIEPYIEPDDSKCICSFCNREIIFAWQLSDGRCMCHHCHDHQKTQKDEIKKLFKETVTMLEGHYKNLELPKNINVRFQSADAIRKVAGGSDDGRIVGFYNHSKRQLWIEARGPSVAMQSTIIHELTHAWQHKALPLNDLAKALPKTTRDKQITILLEGHAVYVELDAMDGMGEGAYAARLKKEYENRDDVYGYGYKFVSEYITKQRIQGSYVTPFSAMQSLVDDVINKEVVIPCPEDL